MELKIYNRSGELKLTVSTSSSSTWNQELMKEYSVSVSFTHPSYVMLDVEDYVLLEGVKFSIKKEYKPRQKDTQTYRYSVKFYAPIHDAEQVKYLHLTDGAYNPQFSLDGGPREHLQSCHPDPRPALGVRGATTGSLVSIGFWRPSGKRVRPSAGGTFKAAVLLASKEAGHDAV